MNKALIVIDMQKGNDEIYQRNLVVKNINKRILNYRDSNHPIIFVQMVSGIKPIFTERWKLMPDLNFEASDNYFNKYQPDAFFETGLSDFLKHRHISSIEIAGAQTQLCIDTTIRIAFSYGYSIFILKDGFSTFDSKLLKAKQINQHHLQIWQNSFAKVVVA